MKVKIEMIMETEYEINEKNLIDNIQWVLNSNGYKTEIVKVNKIE